MSLSFKGGVHPPESKHLSENQPIKVMKPPEVVYIPLSQHAGAPSKPLVKRGDRVLLGQTIGEDTGFISAKIHSSVSGTVQKIGPYPHPITGKQESTIIIENDGKDERAEELEVYGENWRDIDPSKVAEIVKNAGVVGMGGAAFPAHVKLSPPASKEIDTVLLNGAECEPFLTADHRLMLEFPEDILNGLEIIGKVIGAKRLAVCIEENKPDAIEVMRERAKGTSIEIIPLKVKYPQGAEKQMINAVTGREVPSGGLPFDAGCYVQNVGTSKAIYDAISRGLSLYERVVTVSGPVIKNPSNLMIRVGTPYSDIIDECGGPTETVYKVISGGPMMGLAQSNMEVPVTKGTSGILLFGVKDAPSRPEMACINCAKCVDICPMFLMPTRIAAAIEYDDVDFAEKLGTMDCIECGSCSFICPSDRRLLHYIRLAKNKIWEKRAKEKKNRIETN